MPKKSQYPKPRISQLKVAFIIDEMAHGQCSADLWREFVSLPIEHPELETIRLRCLQLPSLFPPEGNDQYCGEEGRDIMFRIINGLCRFPGARRKGHWEKLITPVEEA